MNIKMENNESNWKHSYVIGQGDRKEKITMAIMPFYLIFSGTGGLPINVTDTLAQ